LIYFIAQVCSAAARGGPHSIKVPGPPGQDQSHAGAHAVINAFAVANEPWSWVLKLPAIFCSCGTRFGFAGEPAAVPARNHVQVRILKLTGSRFHLLPGEIESCPLGELLLLGTGLAAAQPLAELLVL
jgi:hypothetical protein